MKNKTLLTQSIAKIEYVANTLANHQPNDMLKTEGMYYVLADVIEEIKEALAGLEEKPAYIIQNKIA